ncbi:phage repressor protein CI [Rosenbergiella nectarea]|uniref:phage repressor protein CI n=1 Tax=Rosenbergiella nectarea TaxID=988801 RepID=UPI001F4E4E30|nr:phage repressor protein CI [Rosenbergiella nectarea]
MIQKWNGQDKDFTNRKVIELPKGGKDPIERICEAYGFKTRQALCRHLDVSQSTMANRIMRENFPADWIIICNLETGASLNWLVTGNGVMFEDNKQDEIIKVSHKIITDGVIAANGEISFDKNDIPSTLTSPFCVSSEGVRYLVDNYQGKVTDGVWLVDIDGIFSVREIYRLPGGKIKVENGKASFECDVSDVNVIAKVIIKTELLG